MRSPTSYGVVSFDTLYFKTEIDNSAHYIQVFVILVEVPAYTQKTRHSNQKCI